MSERLKHYRVIRGWSQEQLARQLGISLNTLQRWELSKTRPSPLAMDRLRELLGEDPESGQISLP